MLIYQYYPLLQKSKNPKGFKIVQDTFLAKLVFELQGKENVRLTKEDTQLIDIYGSLFTQFPKFTYLRIRGYEGKPLRLPRHCLDHFVLIEICRQLAEVDKNYKTQKGFGYTFLVELGHYKYKTIQDDLKLKTEIKSMDLLTYSARPNFDSQEFSLRYSELGSSTLHVPHLEDFWANCQDDFEVRKRLWSRLSLVKIKDFNLPLDTSGYVIEEEGKKLLTQLTLSKTYIEQVEAYPLLEIAWTIPKEDDLHTRTLPILTRTIIWIIRKKHSKLVARGVQKVHASSNSPLVVLGTNEVVPSPTTGKLKSRAKPEHSVQGSFHLPPSFKWTHSHRKKKKKEQTSSLKEACDKSITIDLDLREETFY